jgi:hypothetical protein
VWQEGTFDFEILEMNCVELARVRIVRIELEADEPARETVLGRQTLEKT